MTTPNPFVVPGCEDEPNQPLCPWDTDCGHHEGYYAKVGGQDEEYARFTAKLRRADVLSRAGRLVVISGPELSGKTSLGNRCANWVRGLLDCKTEKPLIVPLRGVCPRRETVRDRVAKVSARLVSHLVDMDPIGWADRIHKNPPYEAHDVLPFFGKIHQTPMDEEPKRYFIILLPSLEPDTAEEEVDVYRAALSDSPGVICVTENPSDAPLPEYRGENPPITLTLRYLRPGESYALVADWPGAPMPGSGTRVVRQTELARLESLFSRMEWNLTVGRLLATLRRIYDLPNYGDQVDRELDYVEYGVVLETYLGQLRRIGQGSA